MSQNYGLLSHSFYSLWEGQVSFFFSIQSSSFSHRKVQVQSPPQGGFLYVLVYLDSKIRWGPSTLSSYIVTRSTDFNHYSWIHGSLTLLITNLLLGKTLVDWCVPTDNMFPTSATFSLCAQIFALASFWFGSVYKEEDCLFSFALQFNILKNHKFQTKQNLVFKHVAQGEWPT